MERWFLDKYKLRDFLNKLESLSADCLLVICIEAYVVLSISTVIKYVLCYRSENKVTLGVHGDLRVFGVYDLVLNFHARSFAAPRHGRKGTWQKWGPVR